MTAKNIKPLQTLALIGAMLACGCSNSEKQQTEAQKELLETSATLVENTSDYYKFGYVYQKDTLYFDTDGHTNTVELVAETDGRPVGCYDYQTQKGKTKSVQEWMKIYPICSWEKLDK